MVKTRQVYLFVTLLVMLVANSAWAASISGTVTNSTGKSGRIYLTVHTPDGGSTGLGTSIAAAGSFSISGVPSGPHQVWAFVDTQGTAIQHANDPRGQSATVAVPTTGNVAAASFAVTNPTAVPAQIPSAVVYSGSGVNFFKWQGALSTSGFPVADRYTVSWSTSETGATIAGTREVHSGEEDYFVHAGVPTLYYRITAWVGTTSVSSGWIQGISGTGAGSVTGRVFFPGLTATGPLYVALVNEFVSPPVIRATRVASPVTGGSYTVTGVPAGTYNILPFLDLNGNGSYDIGDIGLVDTNDFNPTVTVAASLVTAPELTLDNADVSTIITTGHGKSATWEWFNLVLSAQSMKKQAVKVQIVSGPQLTEPVDLGLTGDHFRTRIGMSRQSVGDAYLLELTYADNSTERVTELVTGVLDGFITPVAPVGYVPFSATPTLSWTAPSPAPARYIYSVWMNNAGGSAVWGAWGLQSNRTSIQYGSQGSAAQPLVNGTTYHWILNVTDQNGNMTARDSNFTPSSAPELSGFSPAGGVVGTTVTLTGINFSTNLAAHAVLFNTTPATVTAATSSSLTVQVPSGATTGTIKLTTGGRTLISEKTFIVGTPINIRGVVRTSANAAIAGVRVELADNPDVFTTTSATGAFTLQPLFVGQNVTLKMSSDGYLPTYSARIQLPGSVDLTAYPYHLYTQAQINAWGIAPGRGVIVGRLQNTGVTPSIPVPNALVNTTTVLNGTPYPASYYNGTALGGTATQSNGMFLVLNVRDFDFVEATGVKTAWIFGYTGFNVRANSVSEGTVTGSTLPPSVTSFTPLRGASGATVNITGTNFSLVPAENVVRFTGVGATATVTAATRTQLSVTVPPAATTGTISVTTAGNTAVSSVEFVRRQTLTASVTGSGTVTSVPAGLACTTANCTALFDHGTAVDLIATAGAGGTLSAWSGACTGTGPCTLAMTTGRSVGAAFSGQQYIKNGANYYSLLQDAFDNCTTGQSIQAQDRVFTATAWQFNKPGAQVRFNGGYNATFETNGGFTILEGRLNLQEGTLLVENIKVR